MNSEIDAVRDAELRYAQRYRTPRPNPRRVVIEVQMERVLGSSDLLDRSNSSKSSFRSQRLLSVVAVVIT